MARKLYSQVQQVLKDETGVEDLEEKIRAMKLDSSKHGTL